MIRLAGAHGHILRKRCRPFPSTVATPSTTRRDWPGPFRFQSSVQEEAEPQPLRLSLDSKLKSQSDQEKISRSKEIMSKFFNNRPTNSTANNPPLAGLSQLAKPNQFSPRKSGENKGKEKAMSNPHGPRSQNRSKGNNPRPSSPRRDSNHRQSRPAPSTNGRTGLDIPNFLKDIQESATRQKMDRPITQGQSSESGLASTNDAVNSKERQGSPISDFIRKMQLDAPSSNHSNQSSVVPRNSLPNSGSQPKSWMPGSSSMDHNDTSKSLTDFIRKMQQDHERKQQELKTRQSSRPQQSSAEPLPRWRMFRDQSNLRDLRKQERGQRHRPIPDFGSREERPVRPVYVNPKDLLVSIPSYPVSLAEASLLFREKTRVLLRKLKQLGEAASKETIIEPATMELLAMELNRKFELAESKGDLNDDAILLQRRAEQDTAVAEGYENLTPRAPVVTIMGHVDHGKTTLMDNLRRRSMARAADGGKQATKKKSKSAKSGKPLSTDIAGTEAGGITQVISAFQVPLEGVDQAVTFLDTPGHAAFRAMRQSGSDAADIIVLVVAADDGVSKQTIEILDFYKSIVKEAGENGISLVVAMNKIDKPGIDVDEARRRIEIQLQEQGIQVEGMASQQGFGYGLPVEIYPVSGLTGEGLDDFIEGLALQAEVMDLRADETTGAEGLVVDARVLKGVGIVVDTIVRWGSIRKGDVVVSGTTSGKVRLLQNMNGQPIEQGLPSQPVRIIGFDSVPKAGDPVVCVESEEAANELIERRKALEDKDDRIQLADSNNAELQSSGSHLLHNEWREKLQEKHGIDTESDSTIRIPVVIKADADGTLAAVREALVAIADESTHDLIIDPVRVGVGPVLASDVQLAKEGGATIFAFNLKHEQMIASMATEEKVTLVTSKVIYSLLEDAKVEFANYLPPEPVEVVHGRGKVQAVFDIGGISDKVAGLRVTEGTLFKDKARTKDGAKLKTEYRVLRGGKVLSDATFTASGLKYFKEDVSEVGRGKECGLSLSGCSLFEEGDEIECFSIEMKREFV